MLKKTFYTYTRYRNNQNIQKKYEVGGALLFVIIV